MPVVRVAAIAIVIGIVIFAGGFILYSLEQNTYKQPLPIDPPTGVNVLSEENPVPNMRRIYYVTSDTPENVVAYYDRLMTDYYDTNPEDLMRERCRRIPEGTTVSLGYAPGNGVVPYEYRCLFERSTINLDQYTLIVIQPGVRDDARQLNFEGQTIIQYEQYWQP